MESLAPELLLEIYTLACTDGGLTGCSLSLVSKNIRATSSSARFHTVALSGTSKQLAAFLSCFNKERAIAEARADVYQPTIKHLFFAAAQGGDVRKDWYEGLTMEALLTRYREERDLASARILAARVEAQSAQYWRDVATLFRLISRDLQTLSFVPSDESNEITKPSDIVCPEGFPALREFYLYGKNPYVDDAGGSLGYPHLTHLRLPFSINFQDADLGDWADRAPNVTHLYVSDVDKISQELENIALGGGPFKQLSKLYLEPPAWRGWCGNGYGHYARSIRDFENFVAAAKRHIKGLPAPSERRGLSTEQVAMGEWLDRIGGGVGCWSPIEPRPADWVPAERKRPDSDSD